RTGSYGPSDLTTFDLETFIANALKPSPPAALINSAQTYT
ncbi:unnamed protein product, partial [marine sediment metagenome]